VVFNIGLPFTVTLGAYPSSLTVGDASMLLATVKDKYDNDVEDGTIVTFTTSLGEVGSTEVTKTIASGIATATLTSEESGTAVVTATADSEYGTTNVTFNPDLPFSMTVEADPTSIPIGGFTSTITARVEDEYGNPVADGTEVTFASDLGDLDSVGAAKATFNPNDLVAALRPDEAAEQVEMLSVVETTVNGVATATLVSELTIGTANVSVFAGSATGATQVTFTAGAPHYISVEASPTTIEVGGNTSTIEATVTDIGGYPVADGTPVEISTDFGSLGSTDVTKYTVNGVATATLTSGLTPGTATVTATVDSKSDTVLVNIVPGPPSTIAMTANPTYIPIGGATSDITAHAKDQYGNDVANGTEVCFYPALGSVSPSCDTTINGVAETTLTSGIIKGTATVYGQAGSAMGHVDVIFTVGPPFYIHVEATPTSINLNGHTSDVQATVKDKGGNLVADGTEVIFETSLGSLGSTTVIKTTTGGVAEAVLTSGTVAGTAVITATADTKYDTTEVILRPDPPHTVSLTADPEAICAGGTSQSTIRATVTDQYGNNVANGISVDFYTTNGSIWPASDTTTNGVAETTLTSAEDFGSATVTAICQGKSGDTTVIFYICRGRVYLPVVLKAY
jgi:hypothetical protein